VADYCEVPTALISLVDENRQWFKAACGFDASETSLDQAICLHALEEETFLEIADTWNDPRTRGNPLCSGPDAIRFYAGAILRLDNGVPIGTLCVLDRRPRRLTENQRKTLILLARQVVRQMQLREALAAQQRLRSEVDHRVKNSLQLVASYLRLQRRDAGEQARDVLVSAEQQVAAIVALHGALNEAGSSGTVDMRDYLEKIAGLLSKTLPANVTLEAAFASALTDGSRAAAAGVIVNEFVANSVKHAFPDDDDGTIRLRGTFENGRYSLLLSDDGVGAPSHPSGGIGLSIIDAASRQLRAEISRPPALRGTVLAANFTAEALPDLPSQVAEAG
jgi:two-component sensor histidine kinase